MASKAFASVRVIVFLLALVFLQACLISARRHPHGKKSSAFDFVKQLEGYHKGEKWNGIHDLKAYLNNFGYLSYKVDDSHIDDDDFDDLLEEAVKTYQQNFGLEATGTLDVETISNMVKPRCGVPDIINGRSRMSPSAKTNQQGAHLHTTSHYAFFKGSPKWAPNQYNLTYTFENNFPDKYKSVLIRALQKWGNATHFEFTEIQDIRIANIIIGFHKRDHGDEEPFDGPGGVLAHAFAPDAGKLHFDEEETWVIGSDPKGHDIETSAMHEIGHLLGLEHSKVKEALMYPTVNKGMVRGLHPDDIEGIKALYNQ